MNYKIILLILGLFILSGCSNLVTQPNTNVNIDDGVLRNPQGEPIYDITNESILVTERIASKTLEGHTYDYSNYWTSIASNAKEELYFYTGNDTIYLRMALLSSSNAPARLRIFEDPIITNNGTLQTYYNRDRIKNLTGVSKLYYQPTYTSNGTKLVTHVIVGSKQSGGLCGQDACVWVLQPNTDYLIEMTNLNGNGVEFGYNMLWTEKNNN